MATTHSSVLFQSNDHSIVLLDIPRSIEEAQVPLGEPPTARIYSGAPPAQPFQTPEPKNGGGDGGGWPQHQSPAAQVAELMTAAVAQNALDEIDRCQFQGPFLLPRLIACPDDDDDDVSATPTAPLQGTTMAVIPKDAEYLHGSIQDQRQIFLDTAPRAFRLIVLDPPWPNRSVRRRTDKYATVANLSEMQHLLLSIPVSSHLAPDGLVAMWITNKPSILDFLTAPVTGLFAQWGLELVTEWTWLKITSAGEPLFSMESKWRKPWEKLLIARRIGAKTHNTTTAVLKPKVIMAVPDVHSRKPNLRGLFAEVFREEHGYPALEVFARNLTSGWWSWGNEVLIFQGQQHWMPMKDESEKHK